MRFKTQKQFIARIELKVAQAVLWVFSTIEMWLHRFSLFLEDWVFNAERRTTKGDWYEFYKMVVASKARKGD